jgi:hypothetical protein
MMNPPTRYEESGSSTWRRWYWSETMRVSAHFQRDQHPVGSLQYQWFDTQYKFHTETGQMLRKQMKGKR